MGIIPSYLRGYENQYLHNAREAALQWFRDARYGLFLHYGLYSLLGRGEWVQYSEKIPVMEYERLKDRFTAERFDADVIAEFAMDSGFKYITITTRHHDGFCLFDTKETDFNSVRSPARRDFVMEMATACGRRGLGLCLYYSHGRDWRHPHAPNNDDWGGNARPEYSPPEPMYAYGARHDLQQYLDFMSEQLTELLANYGPITAIWLDGIAVPLSGDSEQFRCQELYDLIHSLQPQVLVSYKQGLLGTEDFLAPEHDAVEAEGKPLEICTAMTKGAWGYKRDAKGRHLTAHEVWAKLRQASRARANLLLNSAPLPDGSFDVEDMVVLREIGERLRREGFPTDDGLKISTGASRSNGGGEVFIGG